MRVVVLRCAAVLTAALLVSAPAFAYAASTPQPAGPWRISKGVAAPWAPPPAEPPTNAELQGKTVTFSRGRVEGPAPLGCANARYEFVLSAPQGLFQGALPAPANRAAQGLGIAHQSVMTLQVSCDTGVFDYHFLAPRTLVVGLDNVVWTLEGPAPADSPEAAAQDLLIEHMTHDMAFTTDSVAPKRPLLTPALALAIDAYFAHSKPTDEPPPIDGDPFTDTQEYPSRFTLEDASTDANGATVPIIFSDGQRTRRVVAMLQRVDGRWLLDDLRYENGTFRELLK